MRREWLKDRAESNFMRGGTEIKKERESEVKLQN